MTDIALDVWLYGNLARFAGEAAHAGYANPQVRLPAGSTVADLLAALGMPTEERGITFINGSLSAMPGLQPDLEQALEDGTRVAFFHLQSMWPFQYRLGARMTEELHQAMDSREVGQLHHAYRNQD
ncbi:MAG: MoaD/ThiS family protein [Chloroflexi bacterium]|nr:MoaD/ThiS family protein [Chloroflexota bacterium]